MFEAVPRALAALSAAAAPAAAAADGVAIAGVPVEFVLFALTLVGVALFHHHTLKVALVGLGAITVYKLAFTGFRGVPGLAGLGGHLAHEWVILVNLLLLLLGFGLLAHHFEKTEIPLVLPRFLPDDWKGAFIMLVMVFVLSSFLDNIAAAMIGGAMAHTLFRGRVHVGYLAAIVAASNAGGAGSVVGDTTTTMMWIAGISPLSVIEAFAGSAGALLVFGIPASLQQHRHSPIVKDQPAGVRVDWARAGIVALVLAAAIVTNVVVNVRFPEAAEHFPFIGAAVWAALLASVAVRKPDWKLVPASLKGSIFLLSLVTCASMMPVEKLPGASVATALGLGFVSAVFDNIPLTALAIKQGGYDWGFLAYAVGFGGSMIWFGSSAGVALSNLYPEAKSVGAWLRHGWHVAVAYVLGFGALTLVVGWHPEAPRHPPRPPEVVDPGAPVPAPPAAPPVAVDPAAGRAPEMAGPARPR
jgi:Na+/H+ antiporter NhaD/arsenite permease-like protein